METPNNKNQYWQKKQKKDERLDTETGMRPAARMRKVWKWFFGIIVLGALALGGWRWVASLAPVGADRSQSFPNLGREHVPAGTIVQYNSNPPTSGSHYSEWVSEKFYDKEIPDGHLVHNLEHGDVWISYNPRIAPEIKSRLKKFASSKVVITARFGNEKDISLAAWTRLDNFNLENGVLDEARVSDFIKRYLNRGPEKVMGAATGGKEF